MPGVALRLQNRARMRRATTLAVLLLPCLAAAQQAAGSITFTEGTSDTVRGRFISAAECAAAGATDVAIAWTFAFTSGTSLPANAQYTIYVANQAHDATACKTTSNTNTGLVVASVDNAAATSATQSKTLRVSVLLAPFTNVTCSTANFPIYVCVQGSGGSSAFGYAKETITLDTTRPGAPIGLGAGVGDGALVISWTEPTGTPVAYDYRLEVTAQNSTLDPTVHQASGIRAERYEMGGLTNDADYDVNVWSVSEAGNESASPAAVVGTPRPVDDFWDYYGRGSCDSSAPCPGREQGGCGAGGTGPLALLGLAALLAVFRRRA